MPLKRTAAKAAKAAKAEKAPARKPATRRPRRKTIGPEEIAVRAYYLHLETGADADENWLRAERELLAV
ncbi:MAG TPA: DUF2934 domain-containing protein [Gaiellaceae bacterium]|nr:DUF2934 domain-containing protein [Gaiellaceae bacterium]